MPRAVVQASLLSDSARFEALLTTRQNPEFLQPLGHAVGGGGPLGVVSGLIQPAGTPITRQGELPPMGSRQVSPVAMRQLARPHGPSLITSLHAQAARVLPVAPRPHAAVAPALVQREADVPHDDPQPESAWEPAGGHDLPDAEPGEGRDDSAPGARAVSPADEAGAAVARAPDPSAGPAEEGDTPGEPVVPPHMPGLRTPGTSSQAGSPAADAPTLGTAPAIVQRKPQSAAGQPLGLGAPLRSRPESALPPVQRSVGAEQLLRALQRAADSAGSSSPSSPAVPGAGSPAGTPWTPRADHASRPTSSATSATGAGGADQAPDPAAGSVFAGSDGGGYPVPTGGYATPTGMSVAAVQRASTPSGPAAPAHNDQPAPSAHNDQPAPSAHNDQPAPSAHDEQPGESRSAVSSDSPAAAEAMVWPAGGATGAAQAGLAEPWPPLPLVQLAPVPTVQLASWRGLRSTGLPWDDAPESSPAGVPPLSVGGSARRAGAPAPVVPASASPPSAGPGPSAQAGGATTASGMPRLLAVSRLPSDAVPGGRPSWGTPGGTMPRSSRSVPDVTAARAVSPTVARVHITNGSAGSLDGGGSDDVRQDGAWSGAGGGDSSWGDSSWGDSGGGDSAWGDSGGGEGGSSSASRSPGAMPTAGAPGGVMREVTESLAGFELPTSWYGAPPSQAPAAAPAGSAGSPLVARLSSNASGPNRLSASSNASGPYRLSASSGPWSGGGGTLTPRSVPAGAPAAGGYVQRMPTRPPGLVGVVRAAGTGEPAGARLPAAGDLAVGMGLGSRDADGSVVFHPPVDPGRGSSSGWPVQRDVAGSDVTGSGPEVQRAQPGPVDTASGGTPDTSGGARASAPEDLETLAIRLYPRISRQLRLELTRERDRLGSLTDFRH